MTLAPLLDALRPTAEAHLTGGGSVSAEPSRGPQCRSLPGNDFRHVQGRLSHEHCPASSLRIPIVFTGAGDPVGFGLVASLARPGGNVTGFSNFSMELMPKRLDLLCALVPRATMIALLANPDNERSEQQIRLTQEAARAKAIQLSILKARTEGEIDTAFAALGQLQAGGLVVGADPIFISRRGQLVALASRYAVPAIYELRGFAAAGGLISYGPDDNALARQAGVYAGRILKGAKPADLPVQQPTTFQLVVNLNTAKALGITVPPSILARADEVIE